MVKCLDCGKKRKTNSKSKVICWDDYQLCAKCCIKKYPERYPLNIIKQFMGDDYENIE